MKNSLTPTKRNQNRRGKKYLVSLDIVGKKFGKWTVLSKERINGVSKLLVECDCGRTKKWVRSDYITCGRSENCMKCKTVTHGESGRKITTEYCSWQQIKNRCLNPNSDVYHLYGGMGIKVHEPWVNSYENFLADVGRAPSRKHTMDRINPNGNYEPGNVRWATTKEQGRNKRNTIIVVYRGETKPLITWCEELGLNHMSVYNQLRYHGVTYQEQFNAAQ